MKAKLLDTPLGSMLAIADDKALHFLDFTDKIGLQSHLAQFQYEIVSKATDIIAFIEDELKRYFKRELTTFNTPLTIKGTPFQNEVWKTLQKIPFGKTCSYQDLAIAIDKPKACRAVARANATNQIPIVIPCHRVIYANGELGGYSGGIERKKWLLAHEYTNPSE